MPNYWMISDRSINRGGESFGTDRGDLTFWLSDGAGALDQLGSWEKSTQAKFTQALMDAVAQFPVIADPARNEEQKHVTLFVHGYNNTWQEEANRYRSICDNLYSGPQSLGICIWFDWPSKGTALGYLPDRSDARECAPDLADVLDEFYESLLQMEKSAAADPTNPENVCRAKLSIIAHSMGNFLLERAMYLLWMRKNQPLLVSLVNQLLMVAADVDNDLFASGDNQRGDDGDGIANLTYRVTALYSGLDAVLGASAGLKHFGKRRLGRSGIDPNTIAPDNVWAVDCTPLLPGGANYPDAWKVHSAYFEQQKIITLMRAVLCGVDRGVLASRGVLTG